MCAGYTVHMMMIVLQQFYNFINVQYPLFLAGRMAYIWKRRYRKKQRDDLQRGGIRPSRKLCHMAERLSKACIVCPYVCQLKTFLKISILDVSNFFCMWLRIFNLQKLMQFNFRGRFTFLHKGPKLGFSCFSAIWFFRTNFKWKFLQFSL